MKTKLLLSLTAIAVLTTLAACGSKSTAETSAASTESPAAAMSDASGMAQMSDMPGMAMDQAAKTGKGIGEITAIDTSAGTVTIKHGAIPAVGWPAMTMTFKANPSSLLSGSKVGEKIGFDVSVKGADAEVTAIQPQ